MVAYRRPIGMVRASADDQRQPATGFWLDVIGRVNLPVSAGPGLLLRRQTGVEQPLHKVVAILVSDVDDSASPPAEAEVWT